MFSKNSIRTKLLLMLLIIMAPLVVYRVVCVISAYQIMVSTYNPLTEQILIIYRNQLWEELILLAIVTVISLVLAWLLGSYYLKPLIALRSAAQKIMSGDYSARTNLKGKDEIGMAAEAFDKMAESIEAWNGINTKFFTDISHDLKTPLNVIFSSVQLMDNYKNNLNSEAYKIKAIRQMNIIRQNCYRIMRLTNNLIDISRHDNGFISIKPINYDIVKLINEITLSVQRYVESKDINLIFESEIESKTIACDPDMIERILLNLISNAIKFTDKNGTISVIIKESENNIVLIVKDTGIGIADEKLNKIFELFGQAEDSALRNREGSGIGLYLVKAFVEGHGGKISVDSQLGIGTSFKIILPVRVLNTEVTLSENDLIKRKTLNSEHVINRINIEFSDIYTCYDKETS